MNPYFPTTYSQNLYQTNLYVKASSDLFDPMTSPRSNSDPNVNTNTKQDKRLINYDHILKVTLLKINFRS